MKIGRRAAHLAWPLVAALIAGCAAPAGSGPPVAAAPAAGASAPAGVAISGDGVLVGRISLSAEEAQDLLNQPDAEQIRRLDILLAAHPDDVAARYLRMQAEDQIADFAPLIADGQVLLANPSLDGHIRAIVLDWDAEGLTQANRFAEAVSAADEALAFNGSDSAALFARGWARYRGDDKQAEAALADLDRGIQIAPGEGIAYFRRATIYRGQGQADRAATDARRAVELAPNDGPSHLLYGQLLFEANDLEQALAQVDAAVRLNPRDPVFWLWRAQVDCGLGRYGDAVADAQRSIDRGATGQALADAYALSGAAFENQLDFKEAARAYQRSLALADDAMMKRDVARMHMYAGEFPQAVETLRQQAALPGTDAYVSLWLFVARGRANPADEPAASSELAAQAPPHQPHVWTDTLVDLMLDRTTLETALAEADVAPTGKLRAGLRCEADYYVAERLLMRGQAVAATPLLEEAYWVCPSTYYEARAVVAERRLLAARASAR